MRKKLELTLACGDYDILLPLIEGEVQPDGIEIVPVTRMDSTTRHWRFLRNLEFDLAELSISSYLLAKDADLPVAALPVFPHRRFRHGFVFVNSAKGIRRPSDLIGKRVGIKSFQVSAILWMRGILEHEYGVPHKSIRWFSELDEDVEFAPPPDLDLTRLPEDKSVETMVATGELDALIHPDLIEPILKKDPRVGRLFPDYKREEMAYFEKTGIFPIMHAIGIKREAVERWPWIAISLFEAFEEAKAIGMARMRNPRIAPIAWYNAFWEEQQEILGPDPWEYGLTARNRKTLETVVGYSHEQGLIRKRPDLDDLFCNVSPGRKRGMNRI
jgi:4,5-dihydroxyphthalate decarboxylase